MTWWRAGAPQPQCPPRPLGAIMFIIIISNTLLLLLILLLVVVALCLLLLLSRSTPVSWRRAPARLRAVTESGLHPGLPRGLLVSTVQSITIANIIACYSIVL